MPAPATRVVVAPHYHEELDGGTEIRLFDPGRSPQDWTDIIRPTQCAVFLKDRRNSVPVAPDGQSYKNSAEVTCVLFDSLAAAQQFCKNRILSLPNLRCEIYDSGGLAHPPLLVIVHPDLQDKEEAGSLSARQRRLIALGLILASLPFFWLARHRSNADFFIFVAFSCVLLALRFLYWHFGVKHRENERRKRLEAHRNQERARPSSAQPSSSAEG